MNRGALTLRDRRALRVVHMADYKPLPARPAPPLEGTEYQFNLGFTLGFLFGFSGCAIVLAIACWWLI